MAEAERILARLRDVQAASITTDGDQIREVHIVAVSTRAPKQIVRDVETALKAFLKRSIDHRMISVALQAPDPEVESAAPVAPVAPKAAPVIAAAPAQVFAPPPVSSAEPKAVSAAPVPRAADTARIRFVNANLFVSGLRTQAEVELSWQGTTRVGNATGASARDSAHRLLASATLSALAPFLGPDVTLSAHDVEIVRMGRQDTVVVAVKLLAQRSEKTLVGACTVEQDLTQSVVYATLAAVNRVLGGLRVAEPVEYELRPTSA